MTFKKRLWDALKFTCGVFILVMIALVMAVVLGWSVMLAIIDIGGIFGIAVALIVIVAILSFSLALMIALISQED